MGSTPALTKAEPWWPTSQPVLLPSWVTDGHILLTTPSVTFKVAFKDKIVCLLRQTRCLKRWERSPHSYGAGKSNTHEDVKRDHSHHTAVWSSFCCMTSPLLSNLLWNNGLSTLSVRHCTRFEHIHLKDISLIGNGWEPHWTTPRHQLLYEDSVILASLDGVILTSILVIMNEVKLFPFSTMHPFPLEVVFLGFV